MNSKYSFLGEEQRKDLTEPYYLKDLKVQALSNINDDKFKQCKNNGTTFFIRNIPYEVSADDLIKAFAMYGTVEKLDLSAQTKTRRKRRKINQQH